MAMVVLAAYTPIHNDYEGQREAQTFWSPYYRIDFKKIDLSLSVNLIYHQQMVSRKEVFPAYALPHLLNRDSGRPAFKDVMIIGDTNTNDPFEETKPESDVGVLRGLDTPEKDDDLFDCHELLKPEEPIASVAISAGFYDQSHFAKAFKRLTGITPAQYRAGYRRH